MRSEYLGLIPFEKAIERQERIRRQMEILGSGAGAVIGFESLPVVTLGKRGSRSQDLPVELGDVPVLELDRGGQATAHNPGQLVIFPILNVRGRGVRNWVAQIGAATEAFARRLFVEAEWRAECSGLYSKQRKLASLGVRIQSGISLHGVAINIRNDLDLFNKIRVCGVAGAEVGHVTSERPLDELFELWCEEFRRQS